jgi:hypothetical protein
MAVFNPFNGDAQPVFALDIQNGSQTGNIGATSALVQPQGPKLDFFAVVVQNTSNQAIDLRDQLGNYSGGGTVFNPGLVQIINESIQQTATIAMYQVQGDANGQISYAIYPSGAYTAAALQTQIRAITNGSTAGNVQITSSSGVTTGVDVTGSDVTNFGFKLATS